MSYGVMAYALDLDVIRSIVGSRSEDDLEEHSDLFEHDAAAIDDLLEDRSEDDAAPLPTARDALRQLIMGERLDDRVGFVYAYCLKFLCDAHGEFLDNRSWLPISSSFLDSVQAALDGAGVPREKISIDHIVFGGSPIPIPPVDDFPGIGYLSKPAVLDALEALSRINANGIADSDVREAVVALTGWLSTCRDQNCDLICFYH